MNKHVVIINGSGSSGKDEFVYQTYKHLTLIPACPMVSNYSSVDWIKSIAKEMGWDGGKLEKDRQLLSHLKDLATWYNDKPFKLLQEKVNWFMDEYHTHKILFLHIREPEEIARAVKEFNAKTLLIKTNRVEHITSNHADANVFNYDYDYVVNNDGTIEDLKEEVTKFIKWLGIEEV